MWGRLTVIQKKKLPLRCRVFGESSATTTLCACLVWGMASVLAVLAISQPSAHAGEGEDFFESHIRPVLAGTCFRCHGTEKTGGGLRVDSLESILKGGDSGPAIVIGKPLESLMVKALRRQSDVSAMPPEIDKALRVDQVDAFSKWIEEGAVWPASTVAFETTKHWAFQVISDPELPEVRDATWGKKSIDAFIQDRREKLGVRPFPAADPLTLIRRATFDLTGFPCTPNEIQAFQNDKSPRAFETVIDRLLASNAYGERWGRHWLDVVRYADTAGETADYPVPLAWRYRNYVIDAFNADKPYDEFLREQIAGDILADRGPREKYAERVIATGYLAISRRFGFDSENYHHLTIQDTIDTLGQSVLGLSIGCARCHDHKFDAITMSDYYGLYGIFDSSRYAFPGSEQKQKLRAMLPLVPQAESLSLWRAFDVKVAMLASALETQKQPVPAALLRSLHDCDGDFEMQAVAAGGSNGVLVPPWLSRGTIAVTNAAQSPFKNFYSRGKVGVHIPAGTGEYTIAQAIYPRRSDANCEKVFGNFDFRVAAPNAEEKGIHRVWIGGMPSMPAFELLISSESLSLRTGERVENLGTLAPNQWHTITFQIDLKRRTVSCTFGVPGNTTDFPERPLSPDYNGVIEFVAIGSPAQTDTKTPSLEFDNFGLQESAIAKVTTELPQSSALLPEFHSESLLKELATITGIDGDFEFQVLGTAPAAPWNPGPNSVVKLATSSQSPFSNLFPKGELGIHMPNRSEYDGFGLAIQDGKPDEHGRLFITFDFRCENIAAGGSGSWRYYIGHGPGNSAAIELFLNGNEFFRRSADTKEKVCPLIVGEWYQVSLTFDTKAKTYTGRLSSQTSSVEYSGQAATGWDGTIDYTFIDSYGHIPGVRPSLDADNFSISSSARPLLDLTASEALQAARISNREKASEMRRQIAARVESNKSRTQELSALLTDGPFEMTYGMAEGTPHNVRMQMRGEPDQPGIEVPRGFIQALGESRAIDESSGSGRLELAQWLSGSKNPLTARVMVNRIWQYHFGRGLVQTPNDFGVRGKPPTHPELLDHLANKFIHSGWSVKAMHREIMLSATYQQASRSDVSDALLSDQSAHDATDAYIGFSRRRLDAEEIRDAILFVSEQLDTEPAREHPFPTPINWGFSQHGPFNAVYDHNKRSIYLMTQRLKRHPFLALFDGADPNATTADRLNTTVPTQALFFLNDPFVHEKAEKWAARLVSQSSKEGDWVDLVWLHAMGHTPNDVERSEATEFLALSRAELAGTKRIPIDQCSLDSLAAYIRTLFGSNEFLHVD